MIANPASAYVHIPFCRRRCFYCDFPISVLGNQQRGETSGTVESYVDRLCEEIAATPKLNEHPLQTVFFGGGTPSLLSVPQLEQILAQIDQHFGIAPTAEISMEMDPGTFDLEHLQGYLAAGITRISLGVQTLDDAMLESCGRYHRVADVYRAVDWLHQVAMPNWSLDLISGLPHQTLTDWETGLSKAVALHPHHLSIYDLTVEPQTVFAKRYQPGDKPLPTDEQTAAMYRLAQAFLTAQGYDHYEVSNYAQPGHQCQHNLTYWRNQPYYGFGLGATSYTQLQRVSRPRTLATYSEWVTGFQAAGGIHSEPPTPTLEQLLDRLMLGLRLKEGISGDEVRSLCDPTTWAALNEALNPHVAQGWIMIEGDTWATLQRLRLSDPEGFLFSNVVLSDCFRAIEDLLES
ncbi:MULTISPECIES: radical SAM family heme chaperone HemW [Cyanophyceae]|uniref:radical SAM family heme chaperone HemW n=1 Tax=Cyanophyceae TaxID=3028117 RepID=UPI00168549E9|nr:MULTISPECIES: radical SAM family heme chaperone HemW [Cyanophyceae]MBD1914458.1 coproporphyrinogen III oxidase [Phormidium sp. FACHB-77]MBD2031031.1 coproporphyrinogen III oxidase [Phormidium sp. FACHB-322]MBD2052136.1 coproporphyrinogen III oxidase [Leptolyngbya sp. FACHB-60]